MADLAPSANAPVSEEERLRRRAQIAGLQAFMENDVPPEHHVACEVRHFFANGVYVREMHAPAGTLIVGKIHKADHITVLVKGEITITTEEGSKKLQAPATLVAGPGIKRVGYCHSDVIWQSIHNVGELRDLAEIEAVLIAPDFDDVALATATPEELEAA